MNYILTIIIAIITAIIWIFVFKKLNILDKPWNDLKNTRKPVPTIQWIFVYIGFFAIIAIVFPEYLSNNLFLWLLFGSMPIVIIEFIEELSYIGKIKLKISPKIRLLFHILWWILAIYIANFWWQEITILWQTYIISQPVFTIFFILRSILCINAINRFDGIYSQASWVSSIWFLSIFLLIKFVVIDYYVWLTPANLEILTLTYNLAFVLFIISLISTIIEFKPIWLLRDVWIMFFGFSIAYLSVLWWAKIWTLLVALSLVILDAIRVWFYRIFILSKNPLKWDYTHLHHRLIWLWRTRKEVRVFVWIRSFVMMVLMLLQWTDRTSKVIIFIMMATIFFGVNIYLFLIKKLPCWLAIQK